MPPPGALKPFGALVGQGLAEIGLTPEDSRLCGPKGVNVRENPLLLLQWLEAVLKFSYPKPETLTYEALFRPSDRRWVERDLDAIVPDGHISPEEIALYCYRLDQAGNGNGQLEIEEIREGMILQDSRFLLEEAESVQLEPRYLEALEELLGDQRLGYSHHRLSRSIDLGGTRTELEIRHAKTAATLAGYHQTLAALARFPAAVARQVKETLLKALASTGTLPQLCPKKKQAPQQGQTKAPNDPLPRWRQWLVYDEAPAALTIPVEKSLVRTVLEQRFVMRDTQGTPTLVPLNMKVRDSYHLKPNDTYRIPPACLKNPEDPKSQALLGGLNTLLEKLDDWMAKPETVSLFQTLVDTVEAGRGQGTWRAEQFKAHLQPLYSQLTTALSLAEPPLTIQSQLDQVGPKGAHGEIAGYFLPPLASSPDEDHGVFLSFEYLFPRPEAMEAALQQEFSAQKLAALSPEALAELAQETILGVPSADIPLNMPDWFLELFAPLPEELFHAWQYGASHNQTPNALPPDRLMDYRDAFQVHHIPVMHQLALTGDPNFYEENPLEHDAKLLANGFFGIFMGRILPQLKFPLPPTQL